MRSMICACTIAAAWLLGISGLVTAAELPENFRLEPVLSGLTDPSGLASTPDGRILITERTTGNLREVRFGELRPTPVCTVQVESGAEAGLLGVAVHPQFNSNHWIYLFYTDRISHRNKVTRFTLGAAGCLGPYDVALNLGAGSSFLRNGGGIAFGPDGKLYLATGDVENSSNGQDDAVLAGKILRLNDDGSTPGDNPTPGNPVYAKGVRDGRGLAINRDGHVYTIDGGQASTVYDELNYVKPGANLGWDKVNGNSGGAYDDPLTQWSPVIGVQGLAVYGAHAFPDVAGNGKDDDHDRFGPDRMPGKPRFDDNGKGECIGSEKNEQPCVTNADCPPRKQGLFTEKSKCAVKDDAAEYCPNGVPYGDDACGAAGTAGIDEADESFLNNLFVAAASGNKILRAVLQKDAPDKLSQISTFLDSAGATGCPTGWTGVLGGSDGWLYAVATNGGGANNGGLYRVIFQDKPGPREVSAPGTYFPLRVDHAADSNKVTLYWEDLREQGMQPRHGATDPLPSVREYTIWQGQLPIVGGSYSHNPVSGMVAVEGTEVNAALRKADIALPADNAYFLISARSDNFEGTLGAASQGTERPGPAEKDLCKSVGYYADIDGDGSHDAEDWLLWSCGKDFTLRDEWGETGNFYEEYRNRVVVLDFSTIWCGPCNGEADKIEQDIHQVYKDRGVKVLTVLVDEDDNGVDWIGRPTPAECRNWADRSPAGTSSNDHTFPCWVDPTPAVGRQVAWPNYVADGYVPHNVILSRGMMIAGDLTGYDPAAIKAILDKMVPAAPVCLH